MVHQPYTVAEGKWNCKRYRNLRSASAIAPPSKKPGSKCVDSEKLGLGSNLDTDSLTDGAQDRNDDF
jgi:hypothetical protein